ncbi:hypothetical protein DPMN_157040 [Dreissena polymorpha]|uniref:C-type lectin domain-containing protein n=1 Tax=Dreissena polymorpha TaxID=45954 RepID=A0A9D4ILW7_DREPO|nr:hypothetical protein DPMN_157040 [Dreissena polymorpha]
MGIIDPTSTNSFVAEHSGTTVNYAYWVPEKPGVTGDQQCTLMSRTYGWKRFDYYCFSWDPVVCEYEYE